VLFSVLAASTSAFGEDSGISGLVRDSTGGVLPGVTVEAASSALIEGSRVAITDGEGRYAITALRPGIYRVTFTLPGFSTVIREGVELTAQFTANINVELRVGAIEETVTVTGATPVVDVQNVVQREVMTRDIIDAVPTNRNWSTLGVLVVGVYGQIDVGGTAGEHQNSITVHGSEGRLIQMEGMTLANMACRYSCTGLSSNEASTQELSYEIGAISAEVPSGGIRVNIIPKEGGNSFSGQVFGNLATSEMQGSNLSDKLKAAGIESTDAVDRLNDTSGAFGGPIARDKLWFWTAHRYWGYRMQRAGAFWEKNPFDFVYDADLSRPAIDDQWNKSNNIRLTWQVSPKNKVSAYYDWAPRQTPHWNLASNRPPEASQNQRIFVNWQGTATFTSTLSSRLLLEAGIANLTEDWTREPIPDAPIDSRTGRPVSFGYPVTEQTTNVNFRATTGSLTHNRSRVTVYKASLSYVTGSHAFKVGWSLNEGGADTAHWANFDTALTVRNGVPRSVTVYTTPYTRRERLVADMGTYAQDTWTIKRVTLNLAARFDYMHQTVPAQDTRLWYNKPELGPIIGGGTWIGPRQFDAVKNVPNWKDFGPRLGVSYDLFGTGKTALKASLSRYLLSDTVTFARALNPLNTTVNTATRSWTDRNGDFIPQLDELGPLNPRNFGQLRVSTRYDPDVVTGFGKRQRNWEFSTGIQHEVMPRVSAEVAYFRRSDGNLTLTDNLLLSPADYDPFCMTAPTDPRLGSVSGSQICGLYDVKPEKFGLTDNFVTFADNFDGRTEIYNGIDVSFNARWGGGLFMAGGFNTGREATENCSIVDTPERRFCKVTPNFVTQYKFNGVYSLPWQALQLGWTFQSYPGPNITASYVATSEEVRGSLGRDLSAGSTGFTVALLEPGKRYGDRWNELDLRVSKRFPFKGTHRIEVMLDTYNLMNVSPVTNINTRYGPQWLTAAGGQGRGGVPPARFFKIGAQYNF